MSRAGDLRTLYRQRPVFTVVALGVLAYFLVSPAIDWVFRSWGWAQPILFHDWGAYGKALIRWQEGEVLYELNDDGGYFGTFLYPPLALLLFYPFQTLLEHPDMRIAWAVLTLLLLWVGIQLVIRELGYRLRCWERALVLWLLVGFQPVWQGFKFGQTPSFMGALLCFSFVAMCAQERDGQLWGDRRWGGRELGILSGALTGVVGFVKFAYAPVGAHLLADRDRMIGAIAAGTVLTAVSIGIFGVGPHVHYLEVLTWGATTGDSPRSPLLLLPAYFKPLGWLPFSMGIRLGATLLVVSVALLAEGRSREIFALGLAVFPVLTPTTYAYYLVPVLPAGLILLAGELERDGHPTVPVVGLFLVNVHIFGLRVIAREYQVFGTTNVDTYYFLAQPALWGILLIASLLFVRAAEGVDSARVRADVRRRLRRPSS